MKYRSVIVTKRGGPDALKIVENDLRPPDAGEARIKILAAPLTQDDVAVRVGNSPYSGIMISLIAVAGLLAFYSLEYLLSRRGFIIWPVPDASATAGRIILPSIRDSWWLLLITVAIVAGALAWTIFRLG